MPQIQILPAAPGFGSQLGQALGSGLNQGIGMALNNMLQQKAEQKKAQQLLSALGISGPVGSQDQSIESSVIDNSISRKGSGVPKLTQEQILAASITNPALAPALSSIYKNQMKESEKQQSEEIAQDSLNRMAEILHQGNIGFGSKVKGKLFGGDTAEQVGEFESLSGALESLLKDRVSKGMLSNARFQYITETLLPKPNDRQATIRGKLKALSRELKLELPHSLSSKQLTTEKAVQFLEQAKGDKEKARKIARAKGYEF